eukprot:TRINITY_DN567_c0_g3_i1.p1 TRINITY_DN567_c0_g3~~TRINITY_DN567_c0_g3_i1.p1  ORF type:complete len:896 (+),score=112.66 TRINITY_DN567_c0_g3_i1:72-2759(+)
MTYQWPFQNPQWAKVSDILANGSDRIARCKSRSESREEWSAVLNAVRSWQGLSPIELNDVAAFNGDMLSGVGDSVRRTWSVIFKDASELKSRAVGAGLGDRLPYLRAALPQNVVLPRNLARSIIACLLLGLWTTNMTPTETSEAPFFWVDGVRPFINAVLHFFASVTSADNGCMTIVRAVVSVDEIGQAIGAPRHVIDAVVGNIDAVVGATRPLHLVGAEASALVPTYVSTSSGMVEQATGCMQHIFSGHSPGKDFFLMRERDMINAGQEQGFVAQCPELLVVAALCADLLPHEAVAVAGVRRWTTVSLRPMPSCERVTRTTLRQSGRMPEVDDLLSDCVSDTAPLPEEVCVFANAVVWDELNRDVCILRDVVKATAGVVAGRIAATPYASEAAGLGLRRGPPGMSSATAPRGPQGSLGCPAWMGPRQDGQGVVGEVAFGAAAGSPKGSEGRSGHPSDPACRDETSSCNGGDVPHAWPPPTELCVVGVPFTTATGTPALQNISGLVAPVDVFAVPLDIFPAPEVSAVSTTDHGGLSAGPSALSRGEVLAGGARPGALDFGCGVVGAGELAAAEVAPGAAPGRWAVVPRAAQSSPAVVAVVGGNYVFVPKTNLDMPPGECGRAVRAALGRLRPLDDPAADNLARLRLGADVAAADAGVIAYVAGAVEATLSVSLPSQAASGARAHSGRVLAIVPPGVPFQSVHQVDVGADLAIERLRAAHRRVACLLMSALALVSRDALVQKGGGPHLQRVMVVVPSDHAAAYAQAAAHLWLAGPDCGCAALRPTLLPRALPSALPWLRRRGLWISGGWGCGKYGGDPSLKVLILWLAASVGGANGFVFRPFQKDDPSFKAACRLLEGVTEGKRPGVSAEQLGRALFECAPYTPLSLERLRAAVRV